MLCLGCGTSNSHDVLQDNLQKAVAALDLLPASTSTPYPPPSKRPRVDMSFSSQGSSLSSKSPDVVVNVGYEKSKRYVLTPRRKPIVKAVARRGMKTVALQALKDPETRKYVLRMLGRELATEVRAMSSNRANSILKSQDPNHLKEFTWYMLDKELSTYAPLLRHLLHSATSTRVLRSNTDTVVGMCAAILLNHRNPKMNLVQKMNALIMYAGYCSKKVYERLHKLNVSVSHSTVIRLLDNVGKDFDVQVRGWRDRVTATLDYTNEVQSRRAPSEVSDDDLFGDSASDSDSDCSWKSYSPITSDDEFSDPDCRSSGGAVDTTDDDDDDDCEPSSCPPANPASGLPEDELPGDGASQTQQTPQEESGKSSVGQCTLYHVCGDNIDKGVKSRYMRVGKDKPQEIHYFHSYAVADRVDFTSLSDQVIPTQPSDVKQIALSLLPTTEDDKALRQNICELMSRMISSTCHLME